jgi:CBS domain-containing protein
MMEEHVYRVPVVRDGKPVGIIARHDLLCIMLKG